MFCEELIYHNKIPLEMSSFHGAFLMLYYMLLKALDGTTREIDAQKMRFDGS